jgi:asparagine synthase (glutamine-hydrolysing)
MIPYLMSLMKERGSDAHLITGNGGALLRDLRPPHPLSDRPLSTMENLTHVLSHDVSRAWLPPGVASDLVDVPLDALLASLRSRLTTYPESSLKGKFLHFAFERLFKFSFEGEDRNRAYLWSSAPYHGLHFTQYALHCPFAQKEKYRLYRTFLRALSPETLRIGYGNFYGFRITPFQYNLYRLLRGVVRSMPSLRRWLNERRGRMSPPNELVVCLLRRHLSQTGGYLLNHEATARLLAERDAQTARSLDNVLSVALALHPPSRSLLDEEVETA